MRGACDVERSRPEAVPPAGAEALAAALAGLAALAPCCGSMRHCKAVLGTTERSDLLAGNRTQE